MYVYQRVITHQGFQSATWDPWRVPFATSDTWDDLPLKFLEATHVDQLNVHDWVTQSSYRLSGLRIECYIYIYIHIETI